MAEARAHLTADDLIHLPEDGKHYELVEGELLEMVPPGGEHGYVAAEVLYRLRAFVEQHRLGGRVFAAETGFRIRRNPDTVRAPDVAYVAEARLAQARVAGYPDLAPDLVVEVVSPGDTAADVQAKVEAWLRAGTQLVWVLYPGTRSAVAYQPDGEARVLHETDMLPGEPVLPGFSCRLAEVF
ncbi:MAG: Uma2 family endonuclease [Chloroflexi bacterium]|nr:Uma2 family endonuclease [Chloroflexota bacterium]